MSYGSYDHSIDTHPADESKSPGYGVVLLGVVYAKNAKTDLTTAERTTVKHLLERFEALLAEERQRQEDANG